MLRRTISRGFKKLSLKNKILLSIISVIILITISNAFVLRFVIVPSLISELKRRGVGIAQSIAERSRDHLLAYHESELSSLVFDEKYLGDRKLFVSYVLVQDKDQKVLAHTFINNLPSDVLYANFVSSDKKASTILLSTLDSPVYDIAVPVLEGLKQIGSVRLGLSKKFIDRLIFNVSILLFIGLFLIIFVSFFVSKWLSSYITRPVSELTNIANRVSQGDLDVAFGTDEQVECWKLRDCGLRDCPVYEKSDARCWTVVGTLLRRDPGLRFPEKLSECRKCIVHRTHSGDELVELADTFSHMVSELKKSQGELQRARDELERRVEERTGELSVANEKLRREIEDRRQVQEALRQVQRQQQAILDASIDVIMQIDDQMKIVWMNRMAAAAGNGNPADLIGQTCYRFFQNSDRPCPGCPCTKALRTGQIEHATMRFHHKNTSEECYWETHGVPLKADSGRVVGVIVISRDVTEKAKAEQAMIQAKEDWENTFDAITDMVMLLDSEQRIIRANKATATVLKTNTESLVGKRCFEVVHKRSAPIAQCPMVYTMKTLKPKTKDIVEPNIGGIFICSTSPILDVDGKLRGFTHTLKDVTESRRLASRLQQAQRLESLGTLAGGIAHDFNNLLMAIQGNASLLLLDIGPSHPHYKRLKSIENQVESGSNLTRQLLGYARKGKYEVGVLDFNQLVLEISETFGRTRKDITIINNLMDNLRAVEADKGQIEQLLLNLFVNAADAMPAGGTLTLETMNVSGKSLTTASSKPKAGDYVLLRVADTGVGMDEETKSRVFEPFFTTKEMGRGTGLGLASAYGIVKGHGGYICVDSELGKGTTFSVFLPATERELRDNGKAPSQLAKGSGTILLVDDEALILELGKELLDAIGFQVLTANGGQEAIEFYERRRDDIDLVILDIVMPKMSGGQTFDRLKAINPDIKVLLSSGYSINGEAKEILTRGCKGFIQKPFTVQKLSVKINEILGEIEFVQSDDPQIELSKSCSE